MSKTKELFRFEFFICEGKIMTLDEAYRYYDIAWRDYCGDFLEIYVWARNLSEARKLFLKFIDDVRRKFEGWEI